MDHPIPHKFQRWLMLVVLSHVVLLVKHAHQDLARVVLRPHVVGKQQGLFAMLVTTYANVLQQNQLVAPQKLVMLEIMLVNVELQVVVPEMPKENIAILLTTHVSVLHQSHCVPRLKLVLEVLVNVELQAPV